MSAAWDGKERRSAESWFGKSGTPPAPAAHPRPKTAPKPTGTPKAWEYCADCDTDLRKWLHTLDCAWTQRIADWDHAAALRLCRECGETWPHRKTCVSGARQDAAYRARCAAGLPPAPPALLRSAAWAGWLSGLQQVGFAHGAELDLGADPGDVNACLSWAVDKGLIQRDPEPTPTPSQQVLSHARDLPSWFGYRMGAR